MNINSTAFILCESLRFVCFAVNLINHPLLSRTLGLVFQSENFNFSRYTNQIMDSWSYLDNPVPELNPPKPRLLPGDDLAAITMLYEQCKVVPVQ